MPKHRRIVSLNRVDESLALFNQMLVPFVIDVRGEEVYFDLGDYVHLLDDEERLQRIRWIRETLVNPEEIRRSHLKSKPFREVYIATIYESEDDLTKDDCYGRKDERNRSTIFRAQRHAIYPGSA